MRSRGQNAVPYSVQRELNKLGDDIRKARIRRKLTMKELAERAFISENTLASVQKGKASVAMGIYARVLALLGITGGIGMLADLSTDPISRDIEAASLPKRVRK
jgi:transcriptional regulator with XRE-family HTH domain